MEREREIYKKKTQTFKEPYQQTHAPNVGQITSRVTINTCNIDLWHQEEVKLFLVSSKKARKYAIYLNMILPQ